MKLKDESKAKKKSCFAVYMRIGDTCLACQSKPKNQTKKVKNLLQSFFFRLKVSNWNKKLFFISFILFYFYFYFIFPTEIISVKFTQKH